MRPATSEESKTIDGPRVFEAALATLQNSPGTWFAVEEDERAILRHGRDELRKRGYTLQGKSRGDQHFLRVTQAAEVSQAAKSLISRIPDLSAALRSIFPTV